MPSNFFIKLFPENVVGNWDIVKFAIRNSLPPSAQDTPDKMTRVLESIVAGELDVWVYYTYDTEVHVKNILTTKIIRDTETDTKSLLIYSVYSFDHTTQEYWEEALMKLKEYAQANGCVAVTGFSKDEYVLRFVESVGGDTSVRFVKIPV